MEGGGGTYLHGHQPVVNHDFLRQASRHARGQTSYGLRRGLTHKSAPMVALYWLLNRLFTYWFMSEVFPTLRKEAGNT